MHNRCWSPLPQPTIVTLSFQYTATEPTDLCLIVQISDIIFCDGAHVINGVLHTIPIRPTWKVPFGLLTRLWLIDRVPLLPRGLPTVSLLHRDKVNECVRSHNRKSIRLGLQLAQINQS